MKLLLHHRFWLILVFCVISAIGLGGERVPVNNGLGWDGKNYAALTLNFEELIKHKEIDSYQYNRIVAPALIFYACKLFHIELSVETIPYVYRAYNFLLIVLVIWLFFKACSHYNFKPETEIIGFSALFFNYFILKNTPYYPILTDITGFCAGMLICYFFVTHQKVALWCSVIAGQITFPLLTLTSVPLLWNLRDHAFLDTLKQGKGLLIMACLAIAVYLALIALVLFWPENVLHPKYIMPLKVFALPISIAWSILYIYRVFCSFPESVIPPSKVSYKKAAVATFCIIVFVLVWNKIVSYISIPEDIFTPGVFIFNIIQQSVSKPFIPLISHVIYFGPGIFITVFYIKTYARTLQQAGDSAIFYFFIIALLFLGSESRQFVPYFPFIILMLLRTLNQYTISRKQVYLFVFMALLSSKCWFPINVPGIFSQYNFGHFPDQRYFMNHGPFMSEAAYIINGMIVMVLGSGMFLLFYKPLSAQTNLTESSSPSL